MGVIILNNFRREQIGSGIYFSTIMDNRFKTGLITVLFQTEIDERKCLAYSAAAELLAHSTKEYPTFLELSRKLDSLYGMEISGGTGGKVGETQLLKISGVCIDDSYSLDGESVYAEMAKLMCSALFEPNAENGAFNETEFKQIKRQLIDNIDAQFNEKRIFAKRRLQELMCEGEKYGISLVGKKELVQELTPENVYDAYEELLKTAKIEIICLTGASDTESVKKIFTEEFGKIERTPLECKTDVIEKAETVREFTECFDVTQSKLLIGFRTACAEPSENVPAEKMMCSVLGGTAHSKLFNNVREKLSLCYYCSSGMDATKGIMTIESGVQKENVEKAKAAILNEIEQMKNGNITDEEIESTKLSIVNSYTTITDTSSGTLGWYLHQILRGGDIRTPEEEAKRINAVNKEMIVEAANRLTLDTIYLLTGEDKEDEE
ncbi:MAG: insulinase family protein [Clostridia bacterium]|nr:insulinase family protein [Clostridia bacterium]